uniref:Peroxidase n=1 Tax=Chenopodium quinoa TaxID=63459 RepID=A0A803MBU9_CHEQI
MAELLSSINMMKINKFSVVLVTILLPLLVVQSKRPPPLTKDYYKKSCPRFDDILNGIITTKQAETPTTAAAVAERDADINLSLPGDAFDLVTRAKTALELECPGIVSCTDILATSARNLITMTGGPFYEIPLGRKDGLVSQASRVLGNLALPNMTMTHIIDMFKIKGFTVQEMVALVGAHTIGFSHCSEFSNRIFHYSKTQPVDPKLNPKYAEGLKKLCANYTKDPTMAAFNDVMTPGKFDNMYYKNLQRGLGLLASDQAMAEDPRTKPTVDLYAANETAFFNDFAKAMLKVSIYKVRSDKDGEVRHRCDSFNK